jgi:arylesterase/paraoxonase
MNLHGFDVLTKPNSDYLRILLVNHRPPIDPVTGGPLDAEKFGANSTIELFETQSGSPVMRHVKTYAHELIQTPNRVTWVSEDAFLYTNDHTVKIGLVYIKLPIP